MQRLFSLVDRIANTKANVLLTGGESGVGKDVFAKLVHKKKFSRFREIRPYKLWSYTRKFN